MKTTKEVKELNNSRVELEAIVADSCQHVLESTIEMDTVSRAKKLGAIIEQLQSETNILDALRHSSTPPEHIAIKKDEIEELSTHIYELHQDTKKFTYKNTQFWGSIVQEE